MATTVDKPYKRSGGPVIDAKVADTDDPYNVGSMMSLVLDSYTDTAGDTYVRLDVGGAIVLGVVFTSATAVGTPVEVADNFEVVERSETYLHAGIVVRVVSTDVADVQLAHAAALTGADTP
jgi:hypothetical protein